MTKQSFVATGAIVSLMIDVSRLGVYATALLGELERIDYPLLLAAVASAFSGALLDNSYLDKVTMPLIQRLVAILLFAVALALMSGLL